MKAIKKYKKGGDLKGANKVTGAKSTQYSKKESSEYWDGAKTAAAATSGRRAAKIYRERGIAGTPQKPSAAMGGAKHVADMLGENTDTIPRRKLTVRELQTAGADKSLKKPGQTVAAGVTAKKSSKRKK